MDMTTDPTFQKMADKIEELEAKKEKLIRLILLSDPAVSNEPMTELSAKQWTEYCTEFPNEI
jgi:hypothetical protein